VALAHPTTYCIHHRGIKEYRLAIRAPRSSKTISIALFGPPGTGKTLWAETHFPTAYRKDPDSWWDGYDGEPAVILDEFHGSWFKFTHLKKLLDRYPMKVDIKGSRAEFISSTVILTSNNEPRSWYNFDNISEAYAWDALERRLDVIVEFGIISRNFVKGRDIFENICPVNCSVCLDNIINTLPIV